MKGHLDVARAKEKTAADGEAFVIETVRSMNKDLESKLLCFLCRSGIFELSGLLL